MENEQRKINEIERKLKEIEDNQKASYICHFMGNNIAYFILLVIFMIFMIVSIICTFFYHGSRRITITLIVCFSVILIVSIICQTILLIKFLSIIKAKDKCNSYDNALKEMLTKNQEESDEKNKGNNRNEK